MITIPLAVLFLGPLVWQISLVGARAAIPHIIRWIALDYAMDKSFELGVEKAEEIAEQQASEDKFDDIFSKLKGDDKISIPYDNAKVFVLINVPEYEYIVNNFKNRGAMTKIFNDKINGLLDNETISASEVLAFRDINHLRNSKLFPKNIDFFKILSKIGSFYYFYGDNFFFVYITGSNLNIYNMIKNYFLKKIPLLRKGVPRDNSSLASIKQNQGKSATEIFEEDRFTFIRFPTIN